MTQSISVFQNENQLKAFLAKNHMNQVINFFGDEDRAMKFFSSVMADVQRNPKLLECTPSSIINAYMTMAQVGFMPSSVSQESYVLPYENNRKVGNEWVKVKEAQFQIGYQGLVTLYYGAGVQSIVAEIVREKDKFSFTNGIFNHEIDLRLSNEERGAPIGAYVTAYVNGQPMTKYMNGKDIIEHAKKYSKSYDPEGKYSPWNPENDRELWMWKKTVIKQHKLLPKNEKLMIALAEDNKDSIIADRMDQARVDSEKLKMGALLTPPPNADNNQKDKDQEGSDDSGSGEGPEDHPSIQIPQ